MQQQRPTPSSHGARRKKPGPKPAPGAHRTHVRRPRINGSIPVHIVMRLTIPKVRRRKLFVAIRYALRHAARKRLLVIAHFTILKNRLHAIVEADSALALSRGMQGFEVCAAKAINRALGRRGRVFADRYYETVLIHPLQVKNCIRYVLNNFRHHRADGCWQPVDPYSNAYAFDGFLDHAPVRLAHGLPSQAPRSWLLRVGWRFYDRFSCWEIPKHRASRLVHAPYCRNTDGGITGFSV